MKLEEVGAYASDYPPAYDDFEEHALPFGDGGVAELIELIREAPAIVALDKKAEAVHVFVGSDLLKANAEAWQHWKDGDPEPDAVEILPLFVSFKKDCLEPEVLAAICKAVKGACEWHRQASWGASV
jgi:hypothetical protein